jgi:hypothetical protein
VCARPLLSWAPAAYACYIATVTQSTNNQQMLQTLCGPQPDSGLVASGDLAGSSNCTFRICQRLTKCEHRNTSAYVPTRLFFVALPFPAAAAAIALQTCLCCFQCLRWSAAPQYLAAPYALHLLPLPAASCSSEGLPKQQQLGSLQQNFC